MGFFKNIGKSIKGVTKMISTKNLIRVATGDASGLVKEATGRILKPHMTKERVRKVQESEAVTNADILAKQKSEDLASNLTTQISENKDGQKVADFLTKAYLKTLYEKHKTKIWVGVAFVVTLIGYALFKKKKR